MNEFAGIRTLEALRSARRRNEEARKKAYERAVCSAADVIEVLNPQRMVSELLDKLSPLMELYRIFKNCGR